MAADFAALVAEIERIEGVVPSVVAALNGVADQIEAAVAADNLADNTVTAGLADRVRAQASALADAVAVTPE
jgi:hypothetical protein